MNKSVLLKSIIDYATEMCKADGHTMVDAGYFVTATLNILLAERRGELDGIPGVKVDDAAALSAEANDVRALFDRYGIDYMDAAVKMESAAKEDYNWLSGMFFQKYERTAEIEAHSAGSDIVRAVDFLNLILKEPTPGIREIIIGNAQNTDESARPARETPSNNAESAAEQDSEDGEDDDDDEDDEDVPDIDDVRKAIEYLAAARRRAMMPDSPSIPGVTDDRTKPADADGAEQSADKTGDGREPTPLERAVAEKIADERRRRQLLDALNSFNNIPDSAENADGEGEKPAPERVDADAKRAEQESAAARQQAMEQRRKELLEALEGMRSSRDSGSAPRPKNPFAEPDEDDLMPSIKNNRSQDTRLIDVAKKAKDLQNTLLSKVFGQDLAVEMFVSGYFQSELVSMGGAKRKKPRATFLFAGPPGVGKTFLAESAAEALGLPFLRVDMSGYAQHESNVEFCGSDRVYKSSHEGDVTGFVNKHPKCVVLFDEVEKAHIDVIHLFLQILDAGRLRDNYLQEEVDFTQSVLILTTNCGKKLYEDPDIVNLSGTPKKTILRAIAGERKQNGDPFFPEPICSRFSSGNVVMFNRLEAHDLLRIVGSEIKNQTKTLNDVGELQITVDDAISYALLYSEGGNADARTMRGKTANFLYGELYEFYRLISSEKNDGAAQVRSLHFDVEPSADDSVKKLFAKPESPEALVFAGGDVAARCAERCGAVKLHFATDVEQAKDIIADNDVSVIVCDIRCGRRSGRDNVLNLEDIDSDGRDLFLYIAQNTKLPLYILGSGNDITTEEMLSFSRNGAMGVIDVDGFESEIYEKCAFAYQQRNMLALAGMRKILLYQTMQTIDGDKATVTLFDLKLAVAVDAEDGNSILSGVSRPSTRFDEVIGADNAKTELGFFIDWLKNPKKYARAGARPPKGILLYGPPGTGKTMLARALAGESEVTFIAAEGNRFLSKWQGEGVDRVHELFATARKYAPSVLFIDEIDAVGISRDDRSAQNSADILTALLTEMDGFKSHPDRPVFVLAATNRGVEGSTAELDPALLRRFDRRLLVDLPNRDEREKYTRLKLASGTSAVSDAAINNIALRSTGMSLAEMESVIELALRNATKTSDCTVTDELLEDAFETFTGGEIKKWSEDSVVRTARHEAGHALLCRLSGEKPSYLTVVARGDHGGYMQHGETEDKQLFTKNELLGIVRTSLGGMAAEVVYYGDEDGLSTGPSSDLQKATGIVMRMICSYGMDGRMGSININALVSSPYYETVRNRVDEILREQYEKAKAAVAEYKPAIDALVDALLKKNKLTGDEIEQILSQYIEK